MKTIRDWISCQFIPKSLLSARPLNFSNEDPPVENNQGSSVAAVSELAFPNSSQSINSNHLSNALPCPQFATTEVSHSSHSSARTDIGRNPLTKVESLLVNYLRTILRFNIPLDNLMVAQVLYRLELASLIQTSESDIKRTRFNIHRARILAVDKEASHHGDLDFSLKILVLGKTGVGKSATINSIFDQNHVVTNAFQPSTDHIQEITGTVNGINVTMIDTPGLFPSNTNQRHNRRVLHSVKRFIRKSPPDIVLYMERLDLIGMGYSDFPILKLMTDIFSPSIWFNTILVMTHCSSGLPEGSDGFPLRYESFVTRCTNLVQHYIQQVISDTKLEIPVLFVENHMQCKTNREGEKVLPNGEAWKRKFFLLCASSKILADANRLLNFSGSLPKAKISTRSPSLPHLLSMLLHPRSLRSSGSDENELDETLDIDDEDDNEYDRLPPFRALTKAQFQRLTKAQKSDYLDELEYRETLYLKKQWKEEHRRRREKMTSAQKPSESYENEEISDSPYTTPLPDMAIPLTFDPDYPVYRYRSTLYSDSYVVRPVLDSEGWDHDIGFDGINLESSIEFKKNFNACVVGQLSKDKSEFNLQTEVLMKYTDARGSSLSAVVDLQTNKKDLIYTIKGDAKLRSLRHNAAAVGLSVTSFRKIWLPGVKFEDVITLGNRFLLKFNAGSLYGCGKVAHGGGFEATIRGHDYPVRDDRLTMGTTLLSFDKEMVLGASCQSNFRAGRGTKISTDVNFNSRRMGRISIKTNASEHVEIALAAAVFSIVRAVFVGKNR